MKSKFEEFLEFCSTSTDLEKIDIAIRNQFNLLKNSNQLQEIKKNELVKKILNAASQNKIKDVRNYAIESYKNIFQAHLEKPKDVKRVQIRENDKDIHETRWEEDKLKKHLEKDLNDIKKLPSKPFLLIYNEMEKILPDTVYEEKGDSDGLAGKIKLKVKSTGKVELFDENIAKVLLEKGAAVKYNEEKKVKEEDFEQKWQRFFSQAEIWKNEALTGKLYSLELLTALLANKFPFIRDKNILKSKAAFDVLVDYENDNLPYLLTKLLTKEHKLKAVDPKNFAQKSKAEVLRAHFETKVKELLERRLPVVFRRLLVSAYEKKLISKSRLFSVQTELSALNRPSVSDYEADQKVLDELNEKEETYQREIAGAENEMDAVDQKVKKEMALIKELGEELPGNKMLIDEILNIYEVHYFQRKQEYLDDRKKESEKKSGYFSSASDILSYYKDMFKKEDIAEEMGPDQVKENAVKMMENLLKFVKDPEARFQYFTEIYGAVQNEVTAGAIIDAIGKVPDMKNVFATMKSFDEMDFNRFLEEFTMFLYNTIKEGTGVIRVHAYAVLSKIGKLHNFEVEKFWYEDWLRSFKYEAQLLKAYPYVEDVTNSFLLGAKFLNAVGTKLFKLKKNNLHNELLKQVQLAREKNDKFLESFYKNLANEI